MMKTKIRRVKKMSSFRALFDEELDRDSAKEFLVELYNRGESIEEIVEATEAMRERSVKIDIDYLQCLAIDIVGTGGDKSGSYNISTTTSLLLASMGKYIAKHGNRSITSKSGSADVLEELGVNLNLEPNKLPKMLNECGYIFMFAKLHHPVMKHIMPIRAEIDHRTIFNILGPLTNPAGIKKQLIGVYSYEFSKKIALALQILNSERVMVVSSRDGLDEVSISDVTYYSFLKYGMIEEGVIDPQMFNMKLSSIEEIKGGLAKENAQITLDLLSNKLQGAKRDILLLNSAAALMVEGSARDMQDGIAMADEALCKKIAIKKLEEIVRVSKSI